MEETTPEEAAPAAPRRLMLGATTVILAVAAALAVLIARQVPQYEAQARLAYEVPQQQSAVDQVATALPSGPGAATTVANRALDSGPLKQSAADSGLSANNGAQPTGAERAAMLRGQLKFSEPPVLPGSAAGILLVTFRDVDKNKASDGANGVAALLANYAVTVNAPVPLAAPVTTDSPKPPPVAGARVSPSAPRRSMEGVSHPPGERSGPHGAEIVPRHKGVGKATTGRRAGSEPADAKEIADLPQQVKRVDGALENLAEVQSELTVEEGQVQTKMLALEKVAKAPGAQSSPEMDTLIQEKERIDSDVSRNRAAVAAEQQRKTELQAQMEQARAVKKADSGKTAPEQTLPKQMDSASPAEAEAGPPVAAAAAASLPATVSGTDAGAAAGPLKITPFRLVEKAGPAVLVGQSRGMLWMWLGIGTAVLLAICLVPIVPAHYVSAPSENQDQEHFGQS